MPSGEDRWESWTLELDDEAAATIVNATPPLGPVLLDAASRAALAMLLTSALDGLLMSTTTCVRRCRGAAVERMRLALAHRKERRMHMMVDEGFRCAGRLRASSMNQGACLPVCLP